MESIAVRCYKERTCCSQSDERFQVRNFRLPEVVLLSVIRQLREMNVSAIKQVQGCLFRGSREIQCLYEAALYTH